MLAGTTGEPCRVCPIQIFLLQKCHQFLVYLVCMGPDQAMGTAFNNHDPCAMYRLCHTVCCGSNREDPVIIAMNNQSGHIEMSQVLPEVSQPGSHAVERAPGRGANPDIPAVPDDLIADSLPLQEVDIIEVCKERREEAGRSATIACLIPSEVLPSTPSGLSGCLQEKGVIEAMNTALLTRVDPYLPI